VSPHRGVRTGRYKLIDYYKEDGYLELFDLEKDPNEVNNVYGDLSYGKVRRELHGELDRLIAQYRVPVV
jgi:arylsulfatase A-like enzyme